MNKLIKAFKILIIISLLSIIYSCDNNSVPKPVGYFRIDLPDTAYHKIDMQGYPYNFEIPTYSQVKITDIQNNPFPYWINIDFKPFNAILYISYRTIDNNVDTLLNDSWQFVMKHANKSDGIESINYINEDKGIYGTMFTIDGMNNASPLQFYLLDSTKHFLRGAIYFNAVPNNDSLKPIIERMKIDVEHIVESTTFNK